jgi:hypothetical protein
MSVADCRRARKRMMLRYRMPAMRTVQEMIDEGRNKAAKAKTIKKK